MWKASGVGVISSARVARSLIPGCRDAPAPNEIECLLVALKLPAGLSLPGYIERRTHVPGLGLLFVLPASRNLIAERI
jgi:hypothetical protein